MIFVTYTVFASAILFEVLAANGAVINLWHPHKQATVALKATDGFLLAASGLLAFTLILRAVTWRQVPLASGADSMCLFLLMVSLLAYGLTRSEHRHALLYFYLPPLAVLSLLGAVVAIQDLSRAPKPLSEILLVLHVVPAFFAYALCFLASLTSIAYIWQARRLKHLRASTIAHKLPSLENLDRTLYFLIGVGYPAFMVTLLLGLFWAWRDQALLGATWWYSPKIILSLFMVVFYGLSFHSRALGIVRGPKLAYMVCSGFAVLLGAYMGLELLHLINYNFWGG